MIPDEAVGAFAGDGAEVEAVVVDAAPVWPEEPHAASEMASTANQIIERARRRGPRRMSVADTTHILACMDRGPS